MYPCAHRQLRDEYITAFREQDRSFSADHLDFGIRLHDFLNPSKWELMELVVMLFRFELGDLVLPVGIQDIAIRSTQALRHLGYR